ncbi:hypothetical protein BASA81_004168 [Batrachochytrium salamandrivorans]|nr:hypothetical protein BASA81_004168 [Batrachochytrium salamandrivorans]
MANEVQEEEVAALHSMFGEDFYLEKPVWGCPSFTISLCSLPPQLQTCFEESDRLVKDKYDSPFVFQLVELARDFLYDTVRHNKPVLGRMEVDLRKDEKLFPPPARPLVPLLRATSTSDYTSPIGTAPSTPKPTFMDQQIENPRIARRGGRYLLDFEELERLGKGGFGVVVKARNRLDGMIYAVKQIRLPKNNDEAMRKTRNEVTTLARLIHPHIVRYFMSWLEDSSTNNQEESSDDDGEEEDDGAFNLSTSLLRPPSAFSNYEDSEFASSLSSSEEEEESSSEEEEESSSSEEESGQTKRNVHHDIKPDNLLIDQNGRVKLGDFGLAVVRSKNRENEEEVGGTALYRAPEIGTTKNWDEKCDIFSLGVVVVEMFCKPMTTSMERIKTLGALKFKPIQLPPLLPISVQTLATLLLQNDPRKRPSASQAYAKAIPTHIVSSQVDSVIKANLVPSSLPYKRLLKYFFSQLPTPEMDDAFDFKETMAYSTSTTGSGGDNNRNRGHALRIYSELNSANVLPPNESLVPVERELTMQLMENKSRKVFQKLGFAAFHVPFLVPVLSPHTSPMAAALTGGQPNSERQFCADVVCCEKDVEGFGQLAMMMDMYDAIKLVIKQEDWSLHEMHLEIGHAQFLPKLLDLIKVPKSQRLALVNLVKDRRQFKDWKECQSLITGLGIPEQCVQHLRFCLPIGNHHFSASNGKDWTSTGEEWFDKPQFLDSLVKNASEQVLQDCNLAEMIDFANFATRFGVKFRLVAWIAATYPPDTTGLFFRCVMRSRRPHNALYSGSSNSTGKHKILFDYGHEFVAADCGRFDDLIKHTGLVGLGTRIYTERISRLCTAHNSTERFLTRPLIRICAPVEKDAAKFEDEERYRVAVRLRQDIAHVGTEWVHPKGLSFEALFSLCREQGARVMISKATTAAGAGGEEWRVRAVSFATELHTLGNFSDKRMQSWDELIKTVTQLVKI